MLLAAVALLGGLAVGRLAGGRLDRLGRLPLRRSGLLAAALAAQLAGTLVGGPFYPGGLAVSAALAAGFLAANRGVRGVGLIALGLLANALVVGLNGAMPVSLHGAATAGIPTEDLRSGGDARHEPAGEGTRLRALGDVIPVLLPWHPEVVSAGDVFVAAGLAQLVVAGMRGARRAHPGLRSPDGPAGRVRP